MRRASVATKRDVGSPTPKPISPPRALKDDPHGLAGVAAYHCQQAVEKLIKGLLVLAGRPAPKVHDLFYLTDLAAPDYPALAPLMERFGELTGWGAVYRYPSIGDEPAPPDATTLTTTLVGIDELAGAFRRMLDG